MPVVPVVPVVPVAPVAPVSVSLAPASVVPVVPVMLSVAAGPRGRVLVASPAQPAGAGSAGARDEVTIWMPPGRTRRRLR